MNTCGGSKCEAYNKATGKEYTYRSGHEFHKRHQKEIDALIEQFRAENRAEYPHMRDNNIAILADIAAGSSSNRDKISAIKELDSIFGFNSTNLNIQGKVDSEIEVNITGLEDES